MMKYITPLRMPALKITNHNIVHCIQGENNWMEGTFSTQENTNRGQRIS